MKPRARLSRRRPLKSLDYNTLAQFRYVLREFAVFSETAAREVGLTSQQHQALLAIRGFAMSAPITIGELAERLGLRPHSVVGLINRLARRRLVVRLADRQDARRVRVGISARGSQTLARLSQVHREELRKLAPLLRRLLAQLSIA